MPPAQILEKNTIRQITFNLYAPFIQEAALSGTVTAGGVLIIITYISHAGGDNLPTRSGWSRRDFNPRLSCRRRPNSVGSHCYGSGKISIHTFLAEGDDPASFYAADPGNFNPHLPRGRWLRWFRMLVDEIAFQSTPSSRKVTHLRQRHDGWRNISIHTFLAEGDQQADYVLKVIHEFQSTPSSRKVTAKINNFISLPL